MPRGYRADLVKSAKKEAPVAVPSTTTPQSALSSLKLGRRTAEWKPTLPTPGILSRGFSSSKNSSSTSLQSQDTPIAPASNPEIYVDSSRVRFDVEEKKQAPTEGSDLLRPVATRNSSAETASDVDAPDMTEDIDDAQSDGSSMYSRDSASIYSSRDSASIYSSASSVYSSGASIYSFDEYDGERPARFHGLIPEEEQEVDEARFLASAHYQRRASTVSLKPQDAAARERSTLVKKAAWFKNSKVRPGLPTYSASLHMWSMVCRAAAASQECYGSRTDTTRRGTYTPSDKKKDIKAMLVDEQMIDGAKVVIVAIRGTKCQSLADWAVNGASDPVCPSDFFDDDANHCHAGFLKVTRAMVAQVASQLAARSEPSDRPALLFTGHSAGGAVAAMLYSHMLSSVVSSELTALADNYSSINCVTFGAPPISLSPMIPKRESGQFLAFANEGDPVLRLSDAAYVKSLAKLMTASPPASLTTVAAPVKVVRRSRGNGVIRQAPAAPVVPWEELPLWATPAAPLTNAGEVILLRDEGACAVASRVTADDLSDVIFGDLAQHTMEMYLRRVKEVALGAMMGL